MHILWHYAVSSLSLAYGHVGGCHAFQRVLPSHMRRRASNVNAWVQTVNQARLEHNSTPLRPRRHAAPPEAERIIPDDKVRLPPHAAAPPPPPHPPGMARTHPDHHHRHGQLDAERRDARHRVQQRSIRNMWQTIFRNTDDGGAAGYPVRPPRPSWPSDPHCVFISYHPLVKNGRPCMSAAMRADDAVASLPLCLVYAPKMGCSCQQSAVKIT